MKFWLTLEKGDYLILQNEINMLDYIIDQAYEKKMKIVMNPSPFDDKLNTCDLGKGLSFFLVNEIEGEQITGCKDKDQIWMLWLRNFQMPVFVLTLGSDGAVTTMERKSISGDIFKVKASGYNCSGRYLYRIFHRINH